MDTAESTLPIASLEVAEISLGWMDLMYMLHGVQVGPSYERYTTVIQKKAEISIKGLND
jgi:hypothetical protein